MGLRRVQIEACSDLKHRGVQICAHHLREDSAAHQFIKPPLSLNPLQFKGACLFGQLVRQEVAERAGDKEPLAHKRFRCGWPYSLWAQWRCSPSVIAAKGTHYDRPMMNTNAHL